MSLENSSQKNNPGSQQELTMLTMSEPVKLSLFEAILNDGISLRIKVTGRSMAPFLQGGEILTIKKVPCTSLHKGDLIFFKDRHGFPILHRIIKKGHTNGTNKVQTKGDALIAFDEPICENDIFGKVCMVEKIGSRDKVRSINMESFIQRNMNYFIALFSSAKTKAYFSARKIYRLLPS